VGLTLIFRGGGSSGSPVTAGPASNLYFLFNEVGAAATGLSPLTGGTATGYDPLELITGPRSTMWRSANFSAAEINYTYPSDVDIDYALITRADLLLSSAGKQIIGRQRDSGGGWTDIPGFIYNPLSSSDLLGPRSQDLVVATTPSALRGFGVYTAPLSGTEASMFSKLYAGTSFSFSVPPPLGLGWNELPPGTYQKPMQSTWEYEVEREFSIRFAGVSQSEVAEFEAKANLLHWPFYLYDSTGDVWDWQLEHVIMIAYGATMVEQDAYVVDMSLARLRHYD